MARKRKKSKKRRKKRDKSTVVLRRETDGEHLGEYDLDPKTEKKLQKVADKRGVPIEQQLQESMIQGLEAHQAKKEGRTLHKPPVWPFAGVGDSWQDTDIRLDGKGHVDEMSVTDRYLLLLDLARKSARDPNFQKKFEPYSKAGYSTLWARLKDAAVFEVPSRLAVAFAQQAKNWLHEHVVPADCLFEMDEPEVEKHKTMYIEANKRIREAANRCSLPELRPFKHMYFGYTEPIWIPPGLRPMFTEDYDQSVEESLDRMYILGHCVLDEVVHIFGWTVEPDGLEKTAMVVSRSRTFSDDEGPELVEWDKPTMLCPWVIPSIIQWINEHKTVIRDDTLSFGYRRAFKKEAKKLKMAKMVPPPYYTVHMQDITVDERDLQRQFRSTFKQVIDWQHRWTVRGHYMVRVKRGLLPLDPSLEQDLRKRRYKVFTVEDPDYATWKHLRRRGIEPKRSDEWIAVLISWRKDHVKGPENKPLIPSLRKSARRDHDKKNAS